MEIEDPEDLLRRLRLGREEYCQRLLTMLILGGGYPKWNSPSSPSAKGLTFLRALHEQSLSTPVGEITAGVFIDEFDLPARHDDEAGGAPDYAVLTDDTIWMIELKTEVSSHRKGQLLTYVELAKHHHPGHAIELTYLTPAFSATPLSVDLGVAYGHTTWGDVVALIESVWGRVDDLETRCCQWLLDVLAALDQPWSEWKEKRLGTTLLAQPDPMDATLALAYDVANEGRQRALDHVFGSLDDLQDFRIEVRDRLAQQSDESSGQVQPWLWNAKTSGGTPLTQSGREVGYELRLSRSSKVAKP